MPKRQVPVYPDKRRDGSLRGWRVVFRDSRGKQSTQRGFATYDEAETWYFKQMGRVKDGEVVVAPDTFGALLPAAVKRLSRDKAPGTVLVYESFIGTHIEPFFASRRFAQIDRELIEDFVDELSTKRSQRGGDELAPSSINLVVGLLASILDVAIAKGHMVKNPARPSKGEPSLKRRVVEEEMDYLRAHEVRQYLEACEPEYRACAEVLTQLGLRSGEVRGVRVRDVDLAARQLHVRGQRLRSGDYAPTKSKRHRPVTFGPRMEEVLRDQLARVTEQGGEYLFPFKHHDLRRLHKQTLKDAGLRSTLRVHDLRHTAASLWLAAGEDIFFVARQLGHTDIRQTNRYSHLAPSRALSGALAAEAALWGEPARDNNRDNSQAEKPVR